MPVDLVIHFCSLVFCFTVLATPVPTAVQQMFTTTYTKDQLKILAAKLQKEFDDLPRQSYDKQCANQDIRLSNGEENRMSMKQSKKTNYAHA